MGIRRSGLIALAALLSAGAVFAQPADLPIPPARTTEFPAGVSVAKLGGKGGDTVYVDARGQTLYGMDMRAGLLRFGSDPSQYCKDACAEEWEPLLAPPGSKATIRYPVNVAGRSRPDATPGSGRSANPAGDGLFSPANAPDWTIIEGPNGPQWVYKVWHMVYTRKGERPRQATAEGLQNMTWNTLKFVPPVPQLTAPSGVGTVFADGAYVLADKDGRVLFTGKCAKDCADWAPLSGGMASAGFGDWQVSRDGDRPQWLYRGKPVFVSQEGGTKVPGKGIALRP